MNGEVDAIGAWLTERIAVYLDLEAADIGADASLASFGIDSVYLAAIIGDIEEHYGLRIESSAVWEHPTIDGLAAHLHGCLNGVQL
ncbi:acyl carrier protein [Micromonospora marina]|nr:acyl carrier protein [Micromonospora sp. CNB394]